jgi:hypothetical protein
MRQILIAILCLISGIAAGGGGTYAYAVNFGLPDGKGPKRPDPSGANKVLAPFKIRAPITYEDGTLATYAVFKIQLVVKEEAAEKAEEKEAFLINAINMRTYKTPLVKSSDGQIADIETFRKVISDASAEALGKGVAANILITDVQPDETGPIQQ